MLAKKAEESIRRGVRNIILVGMPGCGKSTVGKMLAQKLDREFIDADTYIAEKFGRTPEEIIIADGEDAFRSMETEALYDITKLSSAVIACGGGAVLREYNRYLIRQNSVCIYLERKLEKLATGGRPLSAGGPDRLKKLYDQRDPLYREVSDFSVEIHENSGKTVDTIIERVGK